MISKKLKGNYLFWVSLIILCLIIIAWFLYFRIQEDNWMRNSQGMYEEHGNPAIMPDYVAIQKNAINCAYEKYNLAKLNGTIFNSQCLGTCGEYAVDIVSSPRNEEDNKIENQCKAYRIGSVKKFIELDKEGKLLLVHE
ncbi:MAG: hypothetical protein WC867_00125 [Candidatus Pacearchaeota archaeon]